LPQVSSYTTFKANSKCTQCINVGFECKTSDKLSRRAFPRGYTETLEQRVRSLEKDLREANALVEQKSKQLSDASKGDKSKTSLKARLPSESDDEIVIDDVYRLLSRNEVMNGSFLGSSSGRSFFGTLHSFELTNFRTIQATIANCEECQCRV